MSNWINWDNSSGTPAGLDGMEWVEVEYSDGTPNHVDQAYKFKWSSDPIIRYRKTTAPVEPEPDLGWIEWDRSSGTPYNDPNRIVIAEYANGEVSPPTRTYMLSWSSQPSPEHDIVRYRFPQGEVGGPDWGEPSRELHRVYPEYYKDVRHIDYLDTYAINRLFPVIDDSGCLLHARKKLLIPGKRSGGKPAGQDIIEARDTLNRYLQLEGLE